jgi:transposase
VKARTAQANQIRGLLSEFGIAIPQGIRSIKTRIPEILEDGENGLPGTMRYLLKRLRTEMSLHVLAYNMKRVKNIMGPGALMA